MMGLNERQAGEQPAPKRMQAETPVRVRAIRRSGQAAGHCHKQKHTPFCMAHLDLTEGPLRCGTGIEPRP